MLTTGANNTECLLAFRSDASMLQNNDKIMSGPFWKQQHRFKSQQKLCQSYTKSILRVKNQLHAARSTTLHPIFCPFLVLYSPYHTL